MSYQKSKIAGHVCGCLAKPAEVADLLETSARNLFRWRRERNFPRPDAGGRLDLRKVLGWLVADARKREGAPASEREARARLIEERRRRLEIQNDILEKKYVDREDTREQINRQIYAMKGGLEALGRRLSGELVNVSSAETVRRAVDKATRDLLFAFAEGWEPTLAETAAGAIPKHVEAAQSSGGVAGEKITGEKKGGPKLSLFSQSLAAVIGRKLVRQADEGKGAARPDALVRTAPAHDEGSEEWTFRQGNLKGKPFSGIGAEK